ncbi:hypothetical protein MARBORIA2_17850 [Methanobrevibacter arboriphilus]|jgi:hypothetical protein|uniref:Uncharacterized protein n=1 Tax=Methanobrevibacter arboriphilus TaxID=39441 RepID=A0ACA8R4S7_METAZ|nr:hypothetical protein [Methanobrevibacter arboriphilus]BBL62616.1 hypothetical protein MarbSA_16560 [Methanobrevibacter arboriphilus]GLI12695.1 hypothetical protein MARBORIA2_17850 [Methanobrevibacter arboriphilus]
MCFKDLSYKLRFVYNKQKGWFQAFIGILVTEILTLFGVIENYFYTLIVIIIIFASLIIFIILIGRYIKNKYHSMEGKIKHIHLYKEIFNSNEILPDIIEFEIPSFILAIGFKSRVKFNIKLHKYAKDKITDSNSECKNEECLEEECKERTCKNKLFYTLIIDTSNKINIKSDTEYIEENDFELNKRNKRYYYLVQEYDSNLKNLEFSLLFDTKNRKNNKDWTFKGYLEYSDASSKIDLINKNPKKKFSSKNEVFDEKISFCDMESLNNYIEKQS